MVPTAALTVVQDYLVDVNGFKHGHSVSRGLLRWEHLLGLVHLAAVGSAVGAGCAEPSTRSSPAVSPALLHRRRPEIAAERRDLARQLLPPPLADLVCGTQDIFMQVHPPSALGRSL